MGFELRKERTMKKVGIIGWRGMVGSVLMERMIKENDFKRFTPLFFTTSQKGLKAPDVGIETPPLVDAYDIDSLLDMDILSCPARVDLTQNLSAPGLLQKIGTDTGLMLHPP